MTGANNNFVYFITGANSGLGLEATCQLALMPSTKLVYLACRSEKKAMEAMRKLVDKNGVQQSKIQYIHFDTNDSKTLIYETVKKISEPIVHGLILNAGGFGDIKSSGPKSINGVTPIAQLNLIGHVHLVDAFVEMKKLDEGSHIVYSGSEAARGVPLMGMKPPVFKDSEEFFVDVLSGESYNKKYEKEVAYADIKGMAALYFSAFARMHPEIFSLTVSPGGTTGTEIPKQKALSKSEALTFRIMMPMMRRLGKFHSLKTGAKRYVDAVTDTYSSYRNGTFLASKRGVVGPVCDQAFVAHGEQYGVKSIQDAAFKAVRSFV